MCLIENTKLFLVRLHLHWSLCSNISRWSLIAVLLDLSKRATLQIASSSHEKRISGVREKAVNVHVDPTFPSLPQRIAELMTSCCSSQLQHLPTGHLENHRFSMLVGILCDGFGRRD